MVANSDRLLEFYLLSINYHVLLVNECHLMLMKYDLLMDYVLFKPL